MIAAVHDAEFRREALEAIGRVASAGTFILGPEVDSFEEELAEFCGTKYAVGMSSGTDALLAALMAFGIGPGDEVVVPSFSFASTATCISRLGALPSFVGVDPASFHVRPADVAEGMLAGTKAVIGVHLFGACLDAAELLASVPRHVILIEDACQALGASYDGRKVGTTGIAGCLSFFPTKNLGAWGDAGAVITNDAGLAFELKEIRNHGGIPLYRHDRMGGNFRLDELQAAVLRVGLHRLPAWNEARQGIARLYREALSGQPRLILPQQPKGSTWHQFVVRLPEKCLRDVLRRTLQDARIPARIYYPRPLHEQRCFQNRMKASASAYRVSTLCQEVLALPIHPWMQESEVDHVSCVIREALA